MGLSIVFLEPRGAWHCVRSLLRGWGQGFVCSVGRQPLTSADMGKGFEELNSFWVTTESDSGPALDCGKGRV